MTTATTNEYTRRSAATRQRRQARGTYRKPSPAMKKYCAHGVDSLNETEKTIVRSELAAMRVTVTW